MKCVPGGDGWLTAPPTGHDAVGGQAVTKRCCQPGQIDARYLTSLGVRKGNPKLKHSMLVSLCHIK